MNAETLILVDKLAQKLGITAEYLWGILLGQAKYYVIRETIWWLFDIAFVVVAVKIGLWIYKQMVENDHPYSGWDAFLILYGLVAGVIVIAMATYIIGGINTFLMAVFYPEGWALHQILGK